MKIYESRQSCLFFCYHSWITDEDTGKTKYEYCDKCGKRRIIQKDGGYQPVDFTYLEKLF